jgi:3-hydroxybutyryl-CoA dehydrogenase
MNGSPYTKVVIAGSGTIATGLAAVATSCASEVVLLARSAESAERAAPRAAGLLERVEGGTGERLTVTGDSARVTGADLIVEAVTEDLAAKVEVLSPLLVAAPEADLATTTSSLGIAEIGAAAGCADRLVGLHVFNPVTEMKLVELCSPEGVRPEVTARVLAWCEAAGKSAVEVPDTPGFVVNRLLFPYLFDAVRLAERTGVSPQDLDRCMTLGPNHPLGPHALLDLVGLDVAVAIGQALEADTGNPEHLAPRPVLELVVEGNLGRKSGRGFFDYRPG